MLQNEVTHIIAEHMFSAFPPKLSYGAFGYMDSHGMLDDVYSIRLPIVVDNNNSLFVSQIVWNDNYKATGYADLNISYHNQYHWSLLVWSNPAKIQRVADWSLNGQLTTRCGANQTFSHNSSYEESFYMYAVRGFRRELAMFLPYFTISIFVNVSATLPTTDPNSDDLGPIALPPDEPIEDTIPDLSQDVTLPGAGDSTDIGSPAQDVDVRAEFNPLYPQQGFRIYNVNTGKLDWTTYYAYDNHSGAIDGATLRKLGYNAPADFYVLEFTPSGKLIFAHPE